MIEYRHHVSGFFSNRDAAKIAFSKLLEQGLPRALANLRNRLGCFSARAQSGQIVLVADTRTVQETAIARAVIQASVGDYKEVSNINSV